MSADPAPVSRRGLLAGIAGGITATSGCLGRPWAAWEREAPTQIGLDLLSPPEDDNIFALRIAQHVQSNLERAGIQVDIVPTRTATFLREILINHNFDLYVWSHPPQVDPDVIRPLLHSRFAEERGWQNPYGFTNAVVDDLLEQQLQADDGAQRYEYLAELQEVLLHERPFIPIAFKEDHRVMRRDRVVPLVEEPFHSPSWIAGLEAAEEVAETLRLGTTDGRLSHNLNPIAVEYRGFDGVLELVYDSLARVYDDTLWPWLADEWTWSPEGRRQPRLELELRDDLEWHDGEPLTADDVAFTYAFLADTSMREEDPHIPSPRFRGELSVVDSVVADGETSVHLQFDEVSRARAMEALTIPILPEHVWSEWTEIIEVAGIPIDDITTDALVEENLEPVGSGQYRVVEVEADDVLRLELLEDHAFIDIDTTDYPIPALDAPQIEELVIDIRPSVSNIAESIRQGNLDGTLTSLGRELVMDLRTDEDIVSISQQTPQLYHIGFNLRHSPINHAGFRTAVERLIDRLFIREEIFGANPRLARTFVYEQDFVPEELRWDEAAAEQFAGEPGSGDVDVETAREIFRDAGFNYSEDGELLVN